ncbi:MAG: endonuclease III domain-containing protein [Candidatus Micrarchaeota archaeon]
MSVQGVYEKLLKAFGPQGWWPVAGQYRKGDYSTPRDAAEAEEICVGAILTQNTSWKNVEKALECLQSKKLLSLDAIARAKPREVADCVRSSGYYNQKTKKLKAFADFVRKQGGLRVLFTLPAEKLRAKLLSVKGIGPETADSVVLYAARKPKFVVDAYTKRIFSRLGLLSESTSYDEFQRFFEQSLPADYEVFNEFHALLVELAKRNCLKKEPLCVRCPLRQDCAYGSTATNL